MCDECFITESENCWGICLKGSRETMKNIGWCRHYLDRDLKYFPADYVELLHTNIRSRGHMLVCSALIYVSNRVTFFLIIHHSSLSASRIYKKNEIFFLYFRYILLCWDPWRLLEVCVSERRLAAPTIVTVLSGWELSYLTVLRCYSVRSCGLTSWGHYMMRHY